MDRAPGKLPNTSSRLIAAAVSLVGDANEVRLFMQCSEEEFRAYCASAREPTWPQFDRLVQLLVREQGKVIAENRALIEKIRSHKPRA